MFSNKGIFSSKDIPLNICHFLDHFVMLIFAKAAFDSAVFFGISYAEIILYGTLGLMLFGAAAPVAAILAEWYSRRLLLVIFPLGVGFSSVLAGMSQNLMQLGVSLSLMQCNIASDGILFAISFHIKTTIFSVEGCLSLNQLISFSI